MEQHHILVATLAGQGHINPARHLCRRLARATGARVTFSTAISAHRRMFPSSDEDQVQQQHSVDGGGLISYLPYSDGYDHGYKFDSFNDYISRSALIGSQSLSTLVRSLAARGCPVTFVIYTILLPWVADVAEELGVPSVLFWSQPATVFALYHRYFHGYAGLISSYSSHHNNDDPLRATIELPGLPPLPTRDLPSFLLLPSDAPVFLTCVLDSMEGMFRALDRSKQMVLVNTFDGLEDGAMSAVLEGIEMMAIGPMMDEAETAVMSRDLFEEDSRGYMEWLDGKEAGSVVYVSFGSLVKLSQVQMEEILKGLVESGRPYLWVVRQENRDGEGVDLEVGGEMGMVVEWCSQVRVLGHEAVGCFVTHCGWNSTLESMVCGVPMVMVPQWSDQRTNARLAEVEWGIGVRVEVRGEDGVVEGRELRRCIDIVIGNGEMGRRADMWRDKSREAVGGQGSSVRNLRTFLDRLVLN